jgi:hypothetical protein
MQAARQQEGRGSMSPGTLAMTAILTGAAVEISVIAAVAWLVHGKRIVFAATPKDPPQQQGSEPGSQPPPAGGAS